MDEFILFFKIVLRNIARSKEFNKFFPPNSSDDLCLFFCICPSSMPVRVQWYSVKYPRTKCLTTRCPRDPSRKDKNRFLESPGEGGELNDPCITRPHHLLFKGTVISSLLLSLKGIIQQRWGEVGLMIRASLGIVICYLKGQLSVYFLVFKD